MFFPGASRCLEHPSEPVQIDDTTIVFLEFGEQVKVLSETELDKAKRTANKSMELIVARRAKSSL